jgi:hypothetical protein
MTSSPCEYARNFWLAWISLSIMSSDTHCTPQSALFCFPRWDQAKRQAYVLLNDDPTTVHRIILKSRIVRHKLYELKEIVLSKTGRRPSRLSTINNVGHSRRRVIVSEADPYDVHTQFPTSAKETWPGIAMIMSGKNDSRTLAVPCGAMRQSPASTARPPRDHAR